MKKSFTWALVLMLMLNTLVNAALAESMGLRYADEQVLHLIYSGERDSLIIDNGGVTSALGATGPVCTEGLLSKNQYGSLVYGLADSFTVSEDLMTYTFHIREGEYWVDCNGEKKYEVTAHDFVTTAKYICNPQNASNSALFYQNIVKGATACLRGKAEELEGMKALDDHTLEITLERPTPFFLDVVTLYVPLPTAYMNEVGDLYGLEAETTLFVGTYYISDWQPQYATTYVKNPHYWDANNVFIQRIEMTYNAEADMLAPELYRRGEIDEVGIDTSVLDAWMQDAETKDTILPALASAVSFVNYFSFCYAPSFGEEYEQYNYLKAINNENFRQSIAWAIDRYRLKMIAVPYNTELYLANTVTPANWCAVGGVDYTQMEALSEVANRTNWGYDSEKALAFRDAAIQDFAEAGVSLPVRLLCPYDPESSVQINELEMLKQQVEGLLGTDYVEFVVEAGPSSGFTNAVRRAGKYGLLRLSNGGNVADPAQWVIAFQANNNWTFLDQAVGDELKPLVDEYEQMLVDAWNTFDLQKRYNLYAKAEAFLINHALVIPFSLNIAGGYYKCGRLNPFENALGVGATYKGMHLYAEPITIDQFNILQDEYQKNKQLDFTLK